MAKRFVDFVRNEKCAVAVSCFRCGDAATVTHFDLQPKDAPKDSAPYVDEWTLVVKYACEFCHRQGETSVGTFKPMPGGK